jgi:hypothetical protein
VVWFVCRARSSGAFVYREVIRLVDPFLAFLGALLSKSFGLGLLDGADQPANPP